MSQFEPQAPEVSGDRGNGTHLLVEVEEEAVVRKRGGRVGPEEREGRVDVSQLERAARAADEEARPVG